MPTLTTYHIRDRIDGREVTSFEQIVKDTDKVDAYDLPDNMPFAARLFVTRQETRRPSWITFIRKGFRDLDISFVKNISAILVIKIRYDGRDEFFAFTFGHGRHMLKPYCYDLNYGLRVAINAIYEPHADGLDPARIKSVDTKTIAGEVTRTWKQTDRKTSFETFGADAENDLLHGLTGTPINSEVWGKIVSGSSSIVAVPPIEFQELGNYCILLATTFRKTTYKGNFSWIDNIQQINDPELLNILEEELLSSLRSNSDAICITVPEIVELANIEHFSFSFDEGSTFTDPEDAELISALRRTGHFNELSIDKLRDEWTMQAVLAEDGSERNWSLLNCLYGEIRHNRKTYMLTESQFWEVDKDFIDELDTYLTTLPEAAHNLPDSPGDLVESDYNEFAANSSNRLLLLDRKEVSIQGKTTAIEICDLLTDSGCFVHVKRKLCSSTLSHLFAQGCNSAVLLHANAYYREAVLNKIAEQENAKISESGDMTLASKFSSFTKDDFIAGNHEITYAIIAKWRGRTFVGALPFFSKVTLRRCIAELHRIGYKTSVSRINISETTA